MSNDTPLQAQKKWVLHSTDASIAAGQFSVLAVFETLFVLVLYSWLAYHFEYQWWLYLAAMAAPLILLCSEASVARGLVLLKNYKNKNKDDLSRIEKTVIIALAMLASFAISYYLATIWLVDYQDWDLFWRSAIVGFILVAVTGTVAVVGVGVVAVAGTVAVASTVAVAVAGVAAGAAAVAVAGAGAVAVAIAVAVAVVVVFVFVFVFMVEGSDTDKLLTKVAYIILSPFIIMLFLGMALGMWLRSLWIRTIATLQHPILGLRQLPINLREILWRLDLTQAPELLPKAKQVSDDFSVNGIIKKGEHKGLTTKIAYIFMAISWYIPALLWRWSLKATLWLWWPIAFILRSPFEGKTLANIRDITAWRVNGLSKWSVVWLVVLPVAVMVWLLSTDFPQLQAFIELLPAQVKTSLEQIKNYLTVPDMGLRQIMLWLCCIIMLVIWYFSLRLAIIHKGILDNETTLKDLDKEAEDRFIKRVEHLDRLLTIRVVAFIVLGYSYLLYFAYQHYPNDLAHFIPAGLIPYL